MVHDKLLHLIIDISWKTRVEGKLGRAREAKDDMEDSYRERPS